MLYANFTTNLSLVGEFTLGNHWLRAVKLLSAGWDCLYMLSISPRSSLIFY